ncbi:MAG TPA: hypothetical protein VGF31_10580 [Myxococcaceae bacterium]
MIAALALSASSPAVAGSLAFNDPDTGLRIDAPMGKAAVCFLKPVELGSPEGCEGLDVGAIATRVPARASFLTLIRQEDWTFSIALMNQPKPAGRMSREQAREYIRGAKHAAAGFTFESDEPHFEVINGLPVFSYAAVSSNREGFDAMLQYVVPGDQSISTFNFASDSEHLPVMKRLAREFMNGVSRPGLASAGSWVEGVQAPDRYYEMGRAFGALIGNLVVLGLICAGAVLIYRSFRRRGRKAPPGP